MNVCSSSPGRTFFHWIVLDAIVFGCLVVSFTNQHCIISFVCFANSTFFIVTMMPASTNPKAFDGKSSIKIAPSVAKKGAAEIYHHVKNNVSVSTFRKRNSNGANWIVDLRDCPFFDEKEELMKKFRNKPWLSLLFAETKCDVEGTDGNDLIVPLPLQSSINPSKVGGNSVSHRSFIKSEDNLKSKVPIMAFAKSFAEIEKHICILKEAVDESRLFNLATKAEDLLFALQKQVLTIEDKEVLHAMHALKKCLVLVKTPTDDDDAALPKTPTETASLPKTTASGINDGTVCNASTIDEAFYTPFTSIQNQVSTEKDKALDVLNRSESSATVDPDNDDGKIVFDEYLEDDFAETQQEPWE